MDYVLQGPFVNDAPPALSEDVMNAMDQGIVDAHDLQKAENNLPFANLSPGSVIMVVKNGSGFWPTAYDADGVPSYTSGTNSTGKRPTSRTDIFVIWRGVTPFPPTVASGDAGVLNNVDLKIEE